MASTKLSLYQGALRMLAERKLSSISEAREARYLLDDVWDDGAIDDCLQMGQWKFAMRTSELTYSPSVDTPFGYQYAFDRPTDFIRLAAISADEYFEMPLSRYDVDGNYWYADLETLYVRYVSNDASYGSDYSLWPANFSKLVQAYLASEIVTALTNAQVKKDDIKKDLKEALSAALATDAQAGPPVFQPRGYWAMARGNRFSRGGRGPDR
jgi:hypothetical protein